jgi:O-antigen biosynthesis protein
MLRFNIEASSIQVNNKIPCLAISGWCFSYRSNGNVELQVRCDHKVILEFATDIIRKDVEACFPNEITKLTCGFDCLVSLSKKFKTVDVYSAGDDEILASFTEEDVVKMDPDWRLKLACSGDKKGCQVDYWGVTKKVLRVIRRENLFSLSKWSLLLRKSKDEFFRLKHLRNNKGNDQNQLSMIDVFIEKNKIQPHMRKTLQTAAIGFDYQPMISLIMPVYNVNAQYLTEAIASVKAQIYPNWELCIADDASTKQETKDVLAVQTDLRIKIFYRAENGHICKASNDAANQATGEFIALMDNDDLLAPQALFEYVRLLQSNPQADVIYSDEDKIGDNGKHYDLHFKPDWSPTLLLGYNYINHLTCIRRSLFEEVGRFRPGYEGAQDYDLLLRVTEKTDSVFHIPKVLYHWRAIPGSTALAANEKSIVGVSANKILMEALKRRNISASVYQPEFARKLSVPVQQLDFDNDGPSVDIIIPILDKADILKTCINSIIKKTTYKNYHIIVINNDSKEVVTLKYLENLKKKGVQVEHISNNNEGFSFSRINNLAVSKSRSDLVLFLNNDTEIIEPQWLSRMVGYIQLPDIGVTGARLIYPNDSIQHAGVLLGMGGGFIPNHAFCRMDKEQAGYFFLPGTSRECSAVTGACLLTRRETFDMVGGFDEKEFAISLNDIDLCMKIQQHGKKVVYVAGAELYHHESLTRDRNDDPAELANFRDKYGATSDRYYSPNFSRNENYVVSPECTLDYSEFLEKKLKVIFFTHNLNYEGAPNILFEVAKGLKSKGVIESVIASPCGGPQYEQLIESGMQVDIINVRKEGNILSDWMSEDDIEQAVRILSAYFQKEKPDVVVTNVINTFFAVEAAKRLNIPTVWWIHESYDATAMLKNLQPLSLPRAEKAFKDAGSVLFVSQDTSNLYSRYNDGFQFKVIYNSLDAKKISISVTEEAKRLARKRLNVINGKKVIISVGTVCNRKDQGTLVESVKILAKTRTDFVLFLVGYRDSLAYGNYLKRQIEENKLMKFVKLIPETEDVATYYHAADMFAFSSTNESYSLTILEAMAYGLPIITTRCFGVAEQVRFNVNALEVNFGDAKHFAHSMTVFLDDDDKCRLWGRNSREIMRYMQTKQEMLEKHQNLIFAQFQKGMS